MCEPLQGKPSYVESYEPYYSKDDIKSAIAFYKKYRNEQELLIKDYPNIKVSEWILNNHNYRNFDEQYLDFNKWLFDYTFKDVIE